MKHAVFYCENCGNPVPLDVEECPHCQSRFTAVQCPQCSFVGAARLFSSGCPQCGYLSPDMGSKPSRSGTKRPAAKSPQPGAAPAQQREASRAVPVSPRGYRRSSNRLPGWFYTVASIALLAILVALGFIVLHLK